MGDVSVFITQSHTYKTLNSGNSATKRRRRSSGVTSAITATTPSMRWQPESSHFTTCVIPRLQTNVLAFPLRRSSPVHTLLTLKIRPCERVLPGLWVHYTERIVSHTRSVYSSKIIIAPRQSNHEKFSSFLFNTLLQCIRGGNSHQPGVQDKTEIYVSLWEVYLDSIHCNKPPAVRHISSGLFPFTDCKQRSYPVRNWAKVY